MPLKFPVNAAMNNNDNGINTFRCTTAPVTGLPFIFSVSRIFTNTLFCFSGSSCDICSVSFAFDFSGIQNQYTVTETGITNRSRKKTQLLKSSVVHYLK